MNHRYSQSQALLQRAERTIPLGSQTFSKSKVCFPEGAAPLFLEKGQGCSVWDVDNNHYIDFISGLLCVSLGYKDPDVDRAITEQLQSGISFSLPHRLEAEVAERLVDLIPCAEMVRFGKNGSDATAAAIRLARAYTGKEHIAVCGYHGWQDWYIGSTTRHLGVPESTRQLTHRFNYNDIASLEALLAEHPGQFAAVILEPLNTDAPANDFLQQVRDLTHRHGIVLVFDEIITGFRYHLGGAQAHFGVTPDLASFGKGMANGMPISAIVGKKEIMTLMNDIFFSGTFGGETLSLAASKACLDKMVAVDFANHIWQKGDMLLAELAGILGEHSFLELKGLAPWSFALVKASDAYNPLVVKSVLIQEFAKREVLFAGTHNLNLAHDDHAMSRLLSTYREVVPMVQEHIRQGTVASLLNGKAIENVFKVR